MISITMEIFFSWHKSSAVESAFAIKNNIQFNLNQFSKEQLLDCTYYGNKDNYGLSYTNQGCLGGSIYSTLNYIYNNGLHLEADYPYIADVIFDFFLFVY